MSIPTRRGPGKKPAPIRNKAERPRPISRTVDDVMPPSVTKTKAKKTTSTKLQKPKRKQQKLESIQNLARIDSIEVRLTPPSEVEESFLNLKQSEENNDLFDDDLIKFDNCFFPRLPTKNSDNILRSIIMVYGKPPSKEIAEEMIDETILAARELKSSNEEIRRCVFFLVHYDIHEYVKIKRSELFKNIAKESNLNRSTLYDYVNAALVENKLNISQGVMSIDALICLYEKAELGEWQEIFENGMEYKKARQESDALKNKRKHRASKKKPNEYLTKSQIMEAIKFHNRDKKSSKDAQNQETENKPKQKTKSISKKKNRKSLYKGWDSDDQTSSSSDNDHADNGNDKKPSAPEDIKEKLLKKALGMPTRRKELLLEAFSNLSYTAWLAYRLSRRLDTEELEDLKTKLQQDVKKPHQSRMKTGSQG